LEVETKKLIYINGRFLSQAVTGVQRFAIEICKVLIQSNPTKYKLLVPENVIDNELTKSFQAYTIKGSSGHKWEQINLVKFLKSKGNPLLLNLCNTAPLAYNNSVITIHDLAFLHYPKWFSLQFQMFYKFLIPRIASKSKQIFTVSQFAKDDLLNAYKGLNPEKVEVVYNGVSRVFQTKKFTTTYNKPYFLALGGLNPRKNLLKTLEAFQRLDSDKFDLRIVVRSDENFNQIKIHENSKQSLHFHEDIRDQELIDLYSNAAALVYPSLYEGFGIPPLEAINCNCPVIISDIPLFKELYGGYALFVDPNNSDAIYCGMQDIINLNFPKIGASKIEELNQKFNYANSATIIDQRLQQFIV